MEENIPLTNYYVKPDQITDEFIKGFQPANSSRTIELRYSQSGIKV